MLKRLCIASITSFFLVLFVSSAFSQATVPTQAPRIMPPPPEAAALGKYGDFGVGLFSGTPNFSIPLYEIKTPGINVPISLNYSTNGIKVDEIASRVGMSWVLQAGGVINRTVYDKPDFGISSRSTLPPQSDFTNSTATTNTVTWMAGVANNENDTQMDEFNFSFGNYSGKFIIGLNNQPVVIPYSPIKIEFDFNRTDWNFKVTTPDGYKYYFGGVATEKSYSSGCFNVDVDLAPNSWFLTRIEHPVDASDFVEFIYEPVDYSYTTGVSQTITYNIPNPNCTFDAIGPCGSCGPSPFIFGDANSLGNGKLNLCATSLVVDGVILKEIRDGSFNKVVFEYIPKPDIQAGSDYLVDKISIYNKASGEKLKSFDFNYSIVAASNTYTNQYFDNNPVPFVYKPRPFLVEVKEFDKNTANSIGHSFSYNDINNLPRRFSFAQDYWGYFNGVNNQNSLIAKPERDHQLLPPALIANRNPDYTYAAKGLLNKITYPTGGTTMIEYEGNTLDPNYVGGGGQTTGYTQQTNSIVVNGSARIATFQVNETITIQINKSVQCNCPTMANCPPKLDSDIWGQLTSSTGPAIANFTFEEYNLRGECSKTSSSSFTLTPGLYAIGLLPSAQAPYVTSMTLTTPAGKYVSIATPGSLIPTTTALATTGGGLRVKKTISDDGLSGVLQNKLFEYQNIIFPASPKYAKKLVRRELFYAAATTNGIVSCTPTSVSIEAEYVQFNASSLVNLFGMGGAPVYYGKVTEFVSDKTTNGGIEHIYSYSAAPTFIPLIGESSTNVIVPKLTYKNGLELETLSFKWQGSNRIPINKKLFTYTSDARKQRTEYQFLVEKIGELSNSLTLSIRALAFNCYKIPYVSEWQYLSKEQNIEYDNNGIVGLTVTKDYFYDNDQHAQLTRIEFTDSKGQVKKVINKYPGDTNISSLLPTESTAITSLVAQNRINEPIEVDQMSGTTLLERYHHVYETSGGLPLKKQLNRSIGSNPSFLSYSISAFSPQGKVLTYSNSDGLVCGYKYGYNNNYPIVEVKGSASSNVFYTSFEDASGNSADGDCMTGRKSKTNGFVEIVSGLASGSYQLSYWKKISGSWAPQSSTVSIAGSYTINLTGQVDEVRLYPSKAEVDSYSFDPLLGVTSHCDANNTITYYEYDAFNRLMTVKDMWRNILKKIEYRYNLSQ